MVVPVTNGVHHCCAVEKDDWIWLVIWLLVAVAATFTCVGLAIARRNQRRVRGAFMLGVFCGMVAGPILQRRSRRLRALRTAMRSADRFAARTSSRW